ncbi:MAG TPA: hypothetical protein VMT67_05195 [Terriglobales bacterium]|nr:hypothetical protein [Terriglobales bacterium]
MRFRRRLLILIVVLLIAGAVALLVILRKHAPPEAARLLPGADGFFYVNLKWIRTFNASAPLPPILRDPDYQKFVDETGFQFERDLDQAAFAVHYPQAWGAGTGGTATEPRFSEIFVGKFNSSMALAYLKQHANAVDSYRGFDIYNIPNEGRVVRVTFLSYDSVAISNHPDPDVIRGMIDRSRKLASPFSGPSLLRRYYKEVPLTSLSFAILKVRPEAMNSLEGFGSWAMLFPKPAVVVVSARYLRALHLRVEAFTSAEEDAQAIVDKATAFLAIFHAAESSIGTHGTDPDVKAFFESLKVQRTRDRAVLTATVPPGFVKKALAESPMENTPATPPPTSAPPSPPARKPAKNGKP